MSDTHFKMIHLAQTDSTNRWIAEHGGADDAVVWTDFQTAGRGCGTNRWESERGQNLLFSMLIHPHGLLASRQFTISMAVSIAMVRALEPLVGEGLSIKWPNDIYWNHSKLAGILIENRLSGVEVKESIIGVGLNVNQDVFLSDAPNPVSLCQIVGRKLDCAQLLGQLLDCFTLDIDAADYKALLYRRSGFHRYTDKDGPFSAELAGVEPQGHLLLRDSNGTLRRYAFKEVSFLLTDNH